MENNYMLKLFNLICLIIIILNILYIKHLILFNKTKNSDNLKKNENINKKDDHLEKCYKSRSLIFGKNRAVNETNLVTIQSKLNYLIVHESPDFKTNLVDKIMLHDYSIKKLGKDICVPIIKIYNDSKEIKLDELPDKFVLKYNHGSGMNILCNNKSNFDIESAKHKLNFWKSVNYGLITNEYQYLLVNRKIFAEKFLKESIEDYKIYCFHGIPKFIRVQKHVEGISGKINNYYDLDWKLNDIETGLEGFHRRPDIIFEKPKNLELMLDYAKKLSEDLVFVRVDLYNVNGTIYLGEMTFCPSNNIFKLKNRQQSIEIGKLIDIHKIKKEFFIP